MKDKPVVTSLDLIFARAFDRYSPEVLMRAADLLVAIIDDY